MLELDIDAKLTDPVFFASNKYHELFAHLRKNDPVHWTEGNAPRPFWSVSRHADCIEILRQPEVFSSRLGGLMPLTAEEPDPATAREQGFGVIPTHSDPPGHMMLRRPFNKHFSAPTIAKMQESVQKCVDQTVAYFMACEAPDLVDDLTARLPANLVCEMMGVPGRRSPRHPQLLRRFHGAARSAISDRR